VCDSRIARASAVDASRKFGIDDQPRYAFDYLHVPRLRHERQFRGSREHAEDGSRDRSALPYSQNRRIPTPKFAEARRG